MLMIMGHSRFRSFPLLLKRSKSYLHFYDRAFTLVEALLSVALLAVLMISGAYFLTHLTYTSKIGLKQKSVDEWGRIDYLLETDIREALLASSGSIPQGATCLSSPTNPALGLLIPKTVPPGDPQVAYPVVYYNSTQNGIPIIRRCGPNVDADGTLLDSYSDNIAFYDAVLSIASADNLFVDYRITIPSLSLTEQGFARLRARSY